MEDDVDDERIKAMAMCVGLGVVRFVGRLRECWAWNFLQPLRQSSNAGSFPLVARTANPPLLLSTTIPPYTLPPATHLALSFPSDFHPTHSERDQVDLKRFAARPSPVGSPRASEH